MSADYVGKSVQFDLLDHGYLKYIEHYGSDERIIEAARMSTGKGFLGWEAGKCPTCEAVVAPTADSSLLAGKTVVRDSGGQYRICSDCNGTGKIPGDLGLLRRLWVKKHATPFEMAGMIVEVQAPIMVFREWHRHRTQSYNEMSARYTPLPDVNYIPTVERIMLNMGTKNIQAGTVKGADTTTPEAAENFRVFLAKAYREDEVTYQNALKTGIPKELARLCLPVGRYSRMRAAANLRNWLAFLSLRMAEDAQWEIQIYARALCTMLKDRFPRTLQLFLEGRE